MVDKFDERVLVIASEPSDRELLGELLLELTPAARAAASGASETSIGPLRATLLCHRSTADRPRPVLPPGKLDGRVIVLSDRTDESTVVAALEAGAHHYFDITESRGLLKARLAAALRSHSNQLRRELVVPPFRFDLVKRRAWREGRSIELSPKEFDLAHYLFAHRGRSVGNEELMTAVWSLPRTMDSRRIDTAACRVRKKMALEGEEGWRLRRLRGEGYLLVERPETLAAERPDEDG